MTPPALLEELTQSAPANPRPKIGFISLGCPKNLVDSEVMMGMLHHAGGQITPKAEDAEILYTSELQATRPRPALALGLS